MNTRSTKLKKILILPVMLLMIAGAGNSAFAQCEGDAADDSGCEQPNCSGGGCDASFSLSGADNVCQILSPGSYDEVANQCDGWQSPGYVDCGTDPGDPPLFIENDAVEICNEFTAKCDVIENFQIATCANTAYVTGPVTNHIYDSGGNLVCCFDGFGGTDNGTFTPGESYTHCMTFYGYDGGNNYYEVIPWTQVPADPVANFEGGEAEAAQITDPACTGIQYCGFSVTGDAGGGCTNEWDFDNDGVTDATGQSPCYTFPAAGNYPVTLTTCCDGCCADTTLNVIVNDPPTASFVNPGPACAPANLAFDGSASTCPAGGCTYDWDYGDGGTGSGINTTHGYASGGDYTVILDVSDGVCTASDTQIVVVYDRPVITATPINVSCTGANDGSIDLSFSNGSAEYDYSWSGDATGGPLTSVLSAGSISPLDSGTYTISVVDQNGCTRNQNVNVGSDNNCVCNFTPFGFTYSNAGDNCIGNNNYTFTYNGALVSGSGAPIDYADLNWDFGDGVTATGDNATHTFSVSDSLTFTVTLTMTDDLGQTCQSDQNVTISADPNITAGLDKEVCDGASTTFTASGAGAGGSYTWIVVNGSANLTNANTATVTAEPTGGPATCATLAVIGTNSSGCTGTDTADICVNSLIADAGPDTMVCRNTDLVLDGDYLNATVSGEDPNHTFFNGSGACAFADNDATGCQDATTVSVDNSTDSLRYTKEVCVNLTHGNLGEVNITLTNACGNTITLLSSGALTDSCISASTICFNDTGSYTSITALTNADVLAGGTFRPEQSLSNLNDCYTSGAWTLQVTDDTKEGGGGGAASCTDAECQAEYGGGYSYNNGCDCCKSGPNEEPCPAGGGGGCSESESGGTEHSWSLELTGDASNLTPDMRWSTSQYLSTTTNDTTTFNSNQHGQSYEKIFRVTDDNCTVRDTMNVYVCKCVMLLDSLNDIHIDTLSAGGTQAQFQLTEPVKCSTLDPAQFAVACINCPSGNAYSITNVTCVGGTVNSTTGDVISSTIEFTIDPGFDIRDTLRVDPIGGNTVTNVCGDAMLPGKSGGSGIILPAEWIYFKGEAKENGNMLQWATAFEKNNAYFTVMRSTDGIHFDEIGQVAGAGTSEQQSDYEYLDENPVPANAYYRIKQEKVHGMRGFTHVVNIQRGGADLFELIHVKPTPASTTINIGFNTGSIQEVDIKIYDVVGRLVKSEVMQLQLKGYNQKAIKIGDLDKGVYYIQLEQDGNVTQSKFIKN